MRLKKYINEAALRVNPKEKDLIKTILVKKYNQFIQIQGKKRNHNTVHTMMKQAAKEISKKIADLDFNFDTSINPNRKGSAGIGFDKHYLVIIFDAPATFDAWDSEDPEFFVRWLMRMLETIEHEMVHIEQYRQLRKAKDPETAMTILGNQKLRHNRQIIKKGTKNAELDAYLSYHLEIMGHAKSADVEIFNAFDDPDEVINMIKNDEGQDQIAMESQSFDQYYTHMKDRFPKVWKKFMKYLIQYVERRKK